MTSNLTASHRARIRHMVVTSGLVRSADDDRDIMFTPRVEPFMDRVSLREFFPSVKDQGHEGVCTGETAAAVAGAISAIGHQGKLDLSPQFNYYYSRKYANMTGDVGASPRNMCRSVRNYGLCLDSEWPLTKGIDVEPSAAAISSALTRKGMDYAVIPLDEHLAYNMMSAQAEGLIVLFAFYCRDWMLDVYGPLGSIGHKAPPMPSGNVGPNEIVGGHIVPFVGYDKTMFPESGGAFILQNSWATTWGDAGFWSMEVNQATAPGMAMEVRVARSFNGITLGLPPEDVPLTVGQVNAARAKLSALGLGSLGADGSFFFGARADTPYFAAIRAMLGMDSAQMSQVVGIPAADIDTFLSFPGNGQVVQAWKGI